MRGPRRSAEGPSNTQSEASRTVGLVWRSVSRALLGTALSLLRPWVLAVGGTSIILNSGQLVSEVAWKMGTGADRPEPISITAPSAATLAVCFPSAIVLPLISDARFARHQSRFSRDPRVSNLAPRAARRASGFGLAGQVRAQVLIPV